MKKLKMFNKTIRMSVICWLLTGSAYAMPVGGNVVRGNVTNVSNPSAVMVAQANSIVDWNRFNIEKNEKVVFDTNAFTILNRVNGGDESKILGILQDQGKGHLILMNPSGIVVGENAIINANKLTLTTLKITESEFEKLLDGKKATFQSEKPEGVVLNANSKISVNEALNLYGGRIVVADGVEIVSKEYGKASANIMNVREVAVANLENAQSFSTYRDETGEVVIGKAVFGNENAALSSVDIRGVNVNIDGIKSVADDKTGSEKKVTRISGRTTKLKNASLENKQGDMVVVSSERWNSTIGVDEFTAEPIRENYVNLTGTSLKTDKGDVSILAADVDIYGSNINSGKNLIVGGVKRYDNIEGVLTAETYSDSTVNVDNATKVKAAGKSTVYGAILNVNWNKFDQTIATENPLITIQGKDDVTIEDIIEKLKTIKNKEELQRILNLLQTSNGQLVLVNGDTKKLIKPDVQSVEDFMNNNNSYTVLVGDVTQDYIDYLREQNKEKLRNENSKDNSIEKNNKSNELDLLNEAYKKEVLEQVENIDVNKAGLTKVDGAVAVETNDFEKQNDSKNANISISEIDLKVEEAEGKLAKLYNEKIGKFEKKVDKLESEKGTGLSALIEVSENKNVTSKEENKAKQAFLEAVEIRKEHTSIDEKDAKGKGWVAQLFAPLSNAMNGLVGETIEVDYQGIKYTVEFADFDGSNGFIQGQGIAKAKVSWKQSGVEHSMTCSLNFNGSDESTASLEKMNKYFKAMESDLIVSAVKDVLNEFLSCTPVDGCIEMAGVLGITKNADKALKKLPSIKKLASVMGTSTDDVISNIMEEFIPGIGDVVNAYSGYAEIKNSADKLRNSIEKNKDIRSSENEFNANLSLFNNTVSKNK